MPYRMPAMLLSCAGSLDLARAVAPRIDISGTALDSLLNTVSWRLAEADRNARRTTPTPRTPSGTPLTKARLVPEAPLADLLALDPLPPHLANWRDGVAGWPYLMTKPAAWNFTHADDPLLRVRALLPDWPSPVFAPATARVPVFQQLCAGLAIARAGRFDLVADVVRASGDPLRPQARGAFEEALATYDATPLRTAAVRDRRERDEVFRLYAADPDPEPHQRWVSLDWDTVRTHGATSSAVRSLLTHPDCPQDVWERLAAADRTPDVWRDLLTDRDVGRALLRHSPVRDDILLTHVLPFRHSESGTGVVTAPDVLELAHPAGTALADAFGTLIAVPPVRDNGSEGANRVRLKKELIRLTTHHLGDSVDAWTVACRLVDSFPGSVVELLTTAASAVTPL